MTDDTLQKCLALLEAMNSGEAWSPVQVQRYTYALEMLDEPLAKAAMKKLCLAKWRPAPQEILDYAAALASPLPSVEDAYTEMLQSAERHGLYARRDPSRPGVYREGPPSWSHALIGVTVEHLGGWRSVCSGESQMQEGLAKQFRRAFESNAVRWREQVIEALALPPSERPSDLFPVPNAYNAPLAARKEMAR